MVGHAEPVGERRGILIDRSARQQPALADLIIRIDRDVRGGAVEFAALDHAAHDDVMAAPKVRGGEGGHVMLHAQFDRGDVESRDCLVELLDQIDMLLGQARVMVEPVQSDEEHLALRSQFFPRADQPGDDLELVGERVGA